MTSEKDDIKKQKRVLGDEWQDWDGSIDESIQFTRKQLFMWVSALAVFAIIGAVFLFEWLVHPRFNGISPLLADGLKYFVLGFSGILILWLILFIICAYFNLRAFAPIVLVPRVINFILNLTLSIGQLIGIPRDRMVNSFMKVYGVIFKLRKTSLKPQELLVLLPRCLTKECFKRLRSLRERYNFQMFTVGGGQQARLKIRSIMPRAIIAVACERDLLSGFLEVNPKIPVIGFPNNRPEGPCKNTEIDISQIESTIISLLKGNFKKFGTQMP